MGALTDYNNISKIIAKWSLFSHIPRAQCNNVVIITKTALLAKFQAQVKPNNYIFINRLRTVILLSYSGFIIRPCQNLATKLKRPLLAKLQP